MLHRLPVLARGYLRDSSADPDIASVPSAYGHPEHWHHGGDPTLPVVALGVGIGGDYALYVLGVMMTHLRAGVPLEEAYQRSLRFTGRVVMLTGFTLAVGVGTWIFAPIKFQADMGVLLAFMFLWNMFSALVILPALASFLLKPTPGNRQRIV